MSVGFPNSINALSSDSSRRWLGSLTIALFLLALWGGWLFLSSLKIYVTTQQARLEAFELVHPIASEVAGRVVSARLNLGDLVQKGEVLVVLDSEAQRYQLEEIRASIEASTSERRELTRVVEAEEAVVAQMGDAAKAALKETQARLDQAETAALFAEDKAERLSDLKGNGHLPELHILSAESEAKQQRQVAKAERLAFARMRVDQRIAVNERLLRIEQLRQQMIRLAGQIRTSEASAKRLEADISKRTIYAPVTGRIGEISELPEGSVIGAGQRVAAIIPPGELKIVALFPAHEALGRISTRQHARLKLNAFPWTQYGSVAGQVARVASEPRDGYIRAEISIDEKSSALIPYQHGLVGTVEVAVEEVSPATLLLRAVGRLAEPSPPSETVGSESVLLGTGPRMTGAH